jgi:hypothetical protein
LLFRLGVQHIRGRWPPSRAARGWPPGVGRIGARGHRQGHGYRCCVGVRIN